MRKSWSDYFMEFAHLAASRSTCPRRHVGAVLVRDSQILATGYNGAVRGAPHCDDVGCLLDAQGSCQRTVHAELNAIDQAAKHGVSVEGATLFVTDAPCLTCAKSLAQVGIRAVVVDRAYGASDGLDLLEAADVTVQYHGTHPPLPLIGLVGLMGSGKDTAARWLQEEYHYTPVAFADPIRGMVHQLFPDRPRQRELYQSFGDWARQQNSEVFVEWVRRRTTQGGPWVVTDVRFPNELAAIKEEGGVLIAISAPDAVRHARVLARDGEDGVQGWHHATESTWDTLWPQCHTVVMNHTDLSAFRTNLLQAFEGLLPQLEVVVG